jgi:hypothetical protein
LCLVQPIGRLLTVVGAAVGEDLAVVVVVVTPVVAEVPAVATSAVEAAVAE